MNKKIDILFLEPAPPLIIGLEVIPRGLNITWKSDVTSLQDSYAIVYTRNDTGESVKHLTNDSKAVLKNLYPGAAYTIKLYAISYGLWSDPHSQLQTICKFSFFSIDIVKNFGAPEAGKK